MSAAQPIPLLYSGQAGSYFGTEYEGLPTNTPPEVQAVGQQLLEKGLVYQGKLTCSQFAQIDIYTYTTCDRHTAMSVMADEKGLAGIDCVSKFADSSFLTTTTTKVLANAYDDQKLFRISFPTLTAVEILEEHQTFCKGMTTDHGAIQGVFTDLLSIAHIVDEYLTRQQSNADHMMLQFASGLAISGMDQMMKNGDEDCENDFDDSDEDFYYEPIEYDENNTTPFIQAILKDDLAQVEALLKGGAELNPQGWEKEVPLVAAVYRGNPVMINTLITAGANINQLDPCVDAHPIGVAIKCDRLDLVKLLLEAGSSPEGGDMSWTGLTLATQKNNLSIVKMLLDAGADPNADMEDYDRVLLHAAGRGNLEIVQCLVEHGADVNAWSQGDTAILSAAANAHQAVYDYLYPLLDEETRRYADKHGKKDIAKAIKRKAREGNKLTEKLGDAAMYGKLSKVQQLLAEGATANALTSCGKSPLMLAAMYGHLEVMETLIAAGADPNLGGEEDFEEGTTALMYAASSFWAKNRADVIQFLVKRGADVNARNSQGQTALILAGENTDALKALIAAKADVNIRDSEGNTALMLGTWAVQTLLRQAGASEAGLNDVALVEAAHEGDLPKVKELIEAGANMNYQDGSALVGAAMEGNVDVITQLLQAGANANLGWKTGFTPIAHAAYGGHFTCVETLLNAGANPSQRTFDDEGHNALEYARLGQREGNYKDRDYPAVIALLEQRNE